MVHQIKIENPTARRIGEELEYLEHLRKIADSTNSLADDLAVRRAHRQLTDHSERYIRTLLGIIKHLETTIAVRSITALIEKDGR